MYADDLAYVHHTGFADLARGAAPFLVGELARVGPHARVADLGCGSGILAAALLKAGHDVTGVDISPAMLALARTHARRARFVEASLYDVDAWVPVRRPAAAILVGAGLVLPARAHPLVASRADHGSVDAVLAVGEPLSYLAQRGRTPSLASFFRDVARVLRPGGLLAFDVIVAGAPSLARRTFVDGDGWAVLVDTHDDGARLTREITTFTRAGGGWARGHERHVVRVLDVADVKRDLARTGFRVRVRRSYGSHTLAVRRRAFLCTRA